MLPPCRDRTPHRQRSGPWWTVVPVELGAARSGGLAGWAVAVEDPVAVGAGHGHGGVRVEDDLPALPVDHDQMVKRAQQCEVDQAGLAALVAGPDVVRVASRGRLVAARPAAVP